MEIDGKRHWRAYSITSDPEHPDGLLSVTVKRNGEGKVSPIFNDRVRSGQRVFLGEIEGEFRCPTRCRTRCCSCRPAAASRRS